MSRLAPALLSLALMAAACGSDNAQPPPASTTSAPPSTTPAPVCDAPVEGDSGEADGALVREATVEALEHPLMAELALELSRPLQPAVRLVGPEGSSSVPSPTAPVASHTILLAGMRADTTYSVEVDLLDPACGVVGSAGPFSVTTGSLPTDLPAMTAVTSVAAEMSPGLTMFNLLDLRDGFGAGEELTEGAEPPPAGWIFMADADGEIVWYHSEPHPLGDVRMLDDGTILYEFNDTAARRIDLRGNVLEEWAGTIITGRFTFDALGRQVVGDDPVIVDTDSMHHEHIPLPDGTHATLSTEIRVFDGFDEPVCGEDPATFDGTYHLVGDVVVVFDPLTGDVLSEFSLFDYFDPTSDPASLNLCGLPFDFVFPNWLYDGVDDQRRDWTHANAIEVDTANNTLIVSVRHLDALLGLRWKTDDNGPAGELLWHSGPRGDMELLDGEWHLYQHAPELQSDGTVLLYDNGNNRAGLGGEDAPLYSRAVHYAIDPDAKTVEQLWEYRSNRGGQPLFAAFVGDADRLENGNVLITDGGVNGNGDDGLSAQIVEVTPSGTDGGEVVFSLEVEGGVGWIVYRSERIPSVYG